MKKVLSNHNEVCHYWANKIQSEGLASNMFFEGPSIYSYGHHFEIARFVKPDVIIFTSRGYSVSTSKHITYTHRAIPDSVKVFTFPSFDNHAGNLIYALELIKAKYTEAARSRKYTEHILQTVVESAKQLRDYIAEFKVKVTKKQLAEIERAETCLTEDVLTALREKLAEAQKKQVEANRNQINEWIECKRASISSSVKKVFLRVKCNSPELVETSLGANVPLKEARILYKAISAGKSVVNFQIGNYYVNRYEKGTLTIGCHKLHDDEINRFAALQGWVK